MLCCGVDWCVDELRQGRLMLMRVVVLLGFDVNVVCECVLERRVGAWAPPVVDGRCCCHAEAGVAEAAAQACETSLSATWEVLLRREYALRAGKVLARAQPSPMTVLRLWHDRSVFYSALQKRIGVEAVAAEVLRAMPKQNSIPAPTMAGLSHKPFGNEAPTKPRSREPVFNGAGVAERLVAALRIRSVARL